MKVTPMATPQPGQQTSPQSTRDAVVARLAATMRPVETPVNQNAVSPEDMVGNTSIGGKSLQNNTDEETLSATEETPTVIELVEEVKAEQPKTESSEYLRLVRAEKALRAKQQAADQAFKAREAAIAAREQELANKDSQYKLGYISKDTFKQSPLQALAEAGVTYEELTQQLINQQPVDPRIDATIKSLEAKIKAMEEDSSNSKKAQADQQTQAYQAAVKQIKADVSHLVFTDPAYEAVKATNSINDVVELIEKTYAEEGRLMTNEEALQEVEDHLLEEIDKLSKVEKIQKRWKTASTPATTTSVQQTQGSQKPQTQPAKTLTNTMASSRQLSARERALAAFKGEKF